LNPLDLVSLQQWLVFFDARDPAQVEKAEALFNQAGGRAMLILTGGSYIEMQKRWKHPVYFDQFGYLVHKFGITQVPALVMQDGKKLRIDELKV
jgi:conjugal transfer pilus assembly protein TraW